MSEVEWIHVKCMQLCSDGFHEATKSRKEPEEAAKTAKALG